MVMVVLLASMFEVGAQTVEERLTALEAYVAEMQQRQTPAPTSTWANDYRLPSNANPVAQPRSNVGTVLRTPLVIEDPNIASPVIRHALSHRIEHEWRQGPQSAGIRYQLGNPKAFFRGGVMVMAANDTPELMLSMLNADEQTGQPTAPFPIGVGSAVGRIYETVAYIGQNGEVDVSARTNDLIFRYRGGMELRVTSEETTRAPTTVAHFAPPNYALTSTATSWIMGFRDDVSRRIRLKRASQLTNNDFVLHVEHVESPLP